MLCFFYNHLLKGMKDEDGKERNKARGKEAQDELSILTLLTFLSMQFDDQYKVNQMASKQACERARKQRSVRKIKLDQTKRKKRNRNRNTSRSRREEINKSMRER